MSLPRRLAGGAWLVVSAVLAVPFVLAVPCAGAQTPRLPSLPLTQIEERGPSADLDNRAFTLTFAQPVPIRDLLLLLVRGTSLSLIPDPAIGGTFIGELKNVTVRQALASILPPLGLDYTVDGGFVRVFARGQDTRIFNINYIAAERTGSSTVGGKAVDPAALSSAAVATNTKTDLFADLTTGVRTVLSDRASFNLDRKAGLLRATDYPERLDRLSEYLDAVEDRVHRQVEFETRIVEVELKDADAPGVDWRAIAAGLAAESSGGAPTAPVRRSLTGLRVTDVTRFMTLLADQGKVATLQTARLTTLNNEPAIVRSEALTLSVTPQIAPEGIVMLSLTPMLKTPALAESDSLVRVADGETLVVSGFTRTREVRERTNAGFRGGWFGRRTVVTQKRVELLILLTPKVL